MFSDEIELTSLHRKSILGACVYIDDLTLLNAALFYEK